MRTMKASQRLCQDLRHTALVIGDHERTIHPDLALGRDGEPHKLSAPARDHGGSFGSISEACTAGIFSCSRTACHTGLLEETAG